MLKFGGWAQVIVGVGLWIYATQFSVVLGGTDFGAIGEVANIDLMSQREILVMMGGFLLVSGWVQVAAASIVEALQPRAKASALAGKSDLAAGQY